MIEPSYTHTFEYDPIYQLSTYQKQGVSTIEYNHDPLGNRTTLMKEGRNNSEYNIEI